MTTKKPEVYKKECPYCKKPFYSLSKKQLEYNYISHLGSCKFNKQMDETIKTE